MVGGYIEDLKNTYRIGGNFRWCKFSWKCIRTLQKKLLFSWNEPLTTPHQMMATPHMHVHRKMTLNDKAKQA